MKKLIIVASGQSVLDHKLGENIDQFDIVVRFNGYQHGIGKYDEYAGKKTDIMFCNNTQKSLSHLMNFPDIYHENIKFILKRCGKKGKNNKKIKDIILNHYKKDNIIQYSRIIRGAKRKDTTINIPGCIKNPTLGLMAIFYALGNYGNTHKIYIYGYDRIVKKIKDRKYMKHYYEDTKNSNHKHAVRRETDTIRKLISHDFITKII